MKILLLNFARQLFESEEKEHSDEWQRMKSYGEFLDKLFIVTLTAGSNHSPVKISKNVVVVPTNGSNKLVSFKSMFQIGSSICRDHKINLVQTQEPYYTGVVGYYLRKKHECKLVTTVYGSNVYDRNWLKESILNYPRGAVAKWVLERSDFIQVDGSKTQQDLIRHQIPPGKVFKKIVVPHRLEQFYFAEGQSIRRQLLRDRFEKIILFVGRLERQKNVASLLSVMPDILRRCPETLLVVIGNGREEKSLKKRAHNLGIEGSVLFLNQVPFNDLPGYYAASDVFVLPSHYEGFARVLMLAAASGKPIVTTDVSGACDIISDGQSGFVVDVTDMKLFRDRIIEILHNGKMAIAFGENAKRKAREIFDYEYMVRKQMEFWNFACG